MNIRTTIALLALATTGGVAYWQRDQIGSALDVNVSSSAIQTAGTAETLESLEPEQLVAVTVTLPDGEAVPLTRSGSEWTLPGNWPLRQAEAASFLDRITHLNSRFQPIPLAEQEPDLVPFGLADTQQPIIIDLNTEDDTQYRLTLGRPKPTTGENPFTRPTYVRLSEPDGERWKARPEVLRLGPDLFDALNRPVDAYRSRRLFAGERVELALGEGDAVGVVSVTLPAEKVVEIESRDGDHGFTLRRIGERPTPTVEPGKTPGLDPTQLAESWLLYSPVRDRLDPEKLQELLAKLPDVWVEAFVDKPASDPETGLENPEKTLTVTYDGGERVMLLIGEVSRETPGSAPMPPMFPGQPPEPPTPGTSYRYAKLAGNDQVFEIKADHFDDLFASVDDLRDPKLVRFEDDQLRSVTIRQSGSEPIVLRRSTEDDQERWTVEQPYSAPAELSQIAGLLERLKGLSTSAEDVIDLTPGRTALTGSMASAYRATQGLLPHLATAITLEFTSPGDQPQRPRTVTVYVGRHDEEAKKLFVQVEPDLIRKGWEDKIVRVDDDIRELIQRPALAYRGRKLFDFEAGTHLTRVEVELPNQETYILARDDDDASAWKLTQPVQTQAAGDKAGTLASDLLNLQAIDYVANEATPEQRESYGLKEPALVVKLTPKGMPEQQLLIGSKRDDQDDYYAALGDAPGVFVLPARVVEELRGGSLAYRPTQLWRGTVTELNTIEIARPDEKAYTLQQADTRWKITSPFQAEASTESVQPLADAVASVEAERYVAHQADDLAKFGLDDDSKPLRFGVTLTKSQFDADGNLAPKTETHTLLIGKMATHEPTEEEPTPGRYAMRVGGDDPAVFVLTEKIPAISDRPVLALLDPELLRLRAEAVTTIETRTDDKTVTLTRVGDDWKPSTEPPFPVDGPTVRRMLGRLGSLRAEEFAAYGDTVNWADFGLDDASKPESLRITVGEGDGAITQTLTLGKAIENGRRYARVNDNPGVAVLSAFTIDDLALARLDLIDKRLLSFEPVELTGLERKMDDKMLTLQLDVINWNIVESTEEQPADQELMESLAETLANLRAERVAAFAPEDPKPFGLETPTAVLELELGPDAMSVLEIGGPVKDDTEGRHFARVKGENVIAVLPGRICNRLLADPVAFRDRTLARFVSADKIELLRRLPQGPRKLTFVKKAGGWKITEPVTVDTADADLRELHDTLAKLRAEAIVAEKPDDLKRYGLDEPRAEWKLYNGDQLVLDLQVGDREKTGKPGEESEGFRVYARLATGEKKDLVVLLDPLLTARLSAEYREPALWPPLDIAQAQSLTITKGDQSFTLVKDGNTWKLADDPEVKLDTSTVNQTLDTFAGLKAKRFIVDAEGDPQLFGLKEPTRVLRVVAAGGQRVIELGRIEDGTGGAYGRDPEDDSGAIFVLGKIDTERLMRSREDFQAGESSEK